MKMDSRVLILNLPSPPGQRLWRDTAGGFGTSLSCPKGYQPTNETSLHPFLPYAASVLKQAGKEFKIIDCQRLRISVDEILELVKKISPDVIFSIISLPSMRNDLKILNQIKVTMPHVTTVGVGTVCRVIPNEILSKSPKSILLRNSYPYINSMIELVETLETPRLLRKLKGVSYVENGQIFHTSESPESSAENLPNPNYESIPLDGYDIYSDLSGNKFPYVLILESKGCPYGCFYCPYPLGYGKRLTFRSSNEIADEIEYLHYSRGIRVFAFKGQTFAYDKKHSIKICDEIIQRKLDIEWFCESRVDEVNRSLLNKMYTSGCRRIHFGVETGDAETIKFAKPGVTLETTQRAFKLTKEFGLATQAHVILGWPDDTRLTLKNTHDFLLRLNPDVLNLNFLTPYPGTKMYDIAKKQSLFITQDWSNFTSHKVVMKTKNLDADQIYAIKNKIVRDFAIQKLKGLFTHFDNQSMKPKPLFNKTRRLVNRALFPAID